MVPRIQTHMSRDRGAGAAASPGKDVRVPLTIVLLLYIVFIISPVIVPAGLKPSDDVGFDALSFEERSK